MLHYLPFHALRSPDGRYLIAQYPIYYLSSASLLQFVKEKKTAIGQKVLAFGNPDLEDPGKDLQFAEAEALQIQRLYSQSTTLLKKEATEEKSKELSPRHDLIHFAAHAELKEDDPLSSAVLLANEGKDDGRLEVREIFGMDLNANLVVLSGCETGLGKLSTGDELVGLTRAFIYAGTPSVVASLWSVDDSSTAHLMASFYRNLKTMSKVEALRQAQLELIRAKGAATCWPGAEWEESVNSVRHQSPGLRLKTRFLFPLHILLLGAVYFGRGWEMNSIPLPSRPLEPDHLTLVVRKTLERQRLKRGVEILSEEVEERYRLVVGDSAEMKAAVDLAKKTAGSSATVLLIGESGTGKEIFARTIHNWSQRKERPFIAINSVGLSKELLESELFGHEQGAFTGTHRRKTGKIELAHDGTIFRRDRRCLS